MLAYIFIPIVQKELDDFRCTVWNHKRGRKQDGKILPTGIPDIIHENPEEYDAEDCGTAVTDDQLESVGVEYSVDLDQCFIDKELYQRFAQVVNTENVVASDAVESFIFLKENYLEV